MAEDSSLREELEREVESLRRQLRESAEQHERVVAELRHSEEKFKVAFHASPDSVNINRLRDGVYIAVNPGFTHLTGYEPSDVLGRSSLELDIWADPRARDCLVQGLRKDGAVHNLQADFRLKSGEIKTALMSACVIQIQGEPCILSITRDISSRIEAEQALRDSEERLRWLIDLAVDAIVLADSRGVVTELNRRAIEMLGLPLPQVLGQHIATLFSPASLQAAPIRFDLLEAGDIVLAERAIDRPDGGCVPVETSSRRMPDGTYQWIMRDLSERRRAEQERAAMESRIQQAERTEALGRLAGGIAHDFNNLLTPIQAWSSMLLRDPSLGHARAELQEILTAAERAASLTRQILAFSRTQLMQFKPLGLNAEIEQTARMLGRLVGEPYELRMELAPELPQVMADATQVQQVLVNLALNARDASPNGGWIRVRTSFRQVDEATAGARAGWRSGSYVCLEVTDRGQGMDEETLRRAFDPFFTTKEPGKGTGLGLATVRGIVAQHGGLLWATSVVGQGSTFEVYLPAIAAEIMHEPPAPVHHLGRERVLLVEDDALVRAVAKQILEADGYTVVTAEDGSQARSAAVQQGEFDLLLTDVIMPGINGRQLYDALLRANPALKVLFMSGYSDDVLAPHGLVLEGSGRLLAKPFTAAELSTAVRRALDEP